MPTARTLALLCIPVLLALPALATSPPGDYTDPAGDQVTSGPLNLLGATPLKCRDPVFDVVRSNVTLGATQLVVSLTFDDLAGSASCGPLAYPVGERLGVVHLYFNYTFDPGSGYSGHYVAWHHDEAGALCASVYSPQHGSSDGCVSGLGDAGTLSGNTLTWVLPRSGTYAGAGGASVSYDLEGPLEHYGVTYTEGSVSGVIEDRYAW